MRDNKNQERTTSENPGSVPNNLLVEEMEKCARSVHEEVAILLHYMRWGGCEQEEIGKLSVFARAHAYRMKAIMDEVAERIQRGEITFDSLFNTHMDNSTSS